jgi:hypothetical protein
MVPPEVAEQVKAALEKLRLADPDGWPETLVSLTAGFCELDVGTLNLLADASVTVAAEVHQFELERIEDEGTDDERKHRN